LAYRLREAVLVEGNSARDRRVALRLPEKAGAHILREFLGPKKYTLATKSDVMSSFLSMLAFLAAMMYRARKCKHSAALTVTSPICR